MKILFLDIDGVMNCQQSAARTRRDGFDEVPSRCLRMIIERTGAHIVVTGALGRLLPQQQLAHFFDSKGISSDCIVGTTRYRHSTGEAITEWLRECLYLNQISSYAIIDDAVRAHLSPHGHRLVRTDWRTGMTECDAQQVISLLGE